MNISRALLLCLLAPLCLGQSLDENEIQEYIRGVNGAAWEELLEYGLSNLPDVDATIAFNATLAGYELQGKLLLENGFVMSMTGLLPEKIRHRSGVVAAESFVEMDLEFVNLKIFRDFVYEPQGGAKIPDQKYGVVLIQPVRYYYTYKVTKDLTDGTVTVKLSIGGAQPGSNILRFDPLNELTARLSKSYRSQADVLAGLYDLWRPKFQDILDKVVRWIPFPPLHLESKRKS